MPDTTNLHATCLAVGTYGVLLLGPPGSGKSDLALRLLDSPGRGAGGEMVQAKLVSDDQVLIRRSGDRLIASAPPALKGLLEVRGLGIVRSSALCDEIAVSIAFQLVASGKIDRLPDSAGRQIDILDVAVPVLEIAPFHASAPAFVHTAAAMHPYLFSNSGEVSACEPGSFTA